MLYLFTATTISKTTAKRAIREPHIMRMRERSSDTSSLGWYFTKEGGGVSTRVMGVLVCKSTGGGGVSNSTGTQG